jgi:hypothetical protein
MLIQNFSSPIYLVSYSNLSSDISLHECVFPDGKPQKSSEKIRSSVQISDFPPSPSISTALALGMEARQKLALRLLYFCWRDAADRNACGGRNRKSSKLTNLNHFGVTKCQRMRKHRARSANIYIREQDVCLRRTKLRLLCAGSQATRTGQGAKFLFSANRGQN